MNRTQMALGSILCVQVVLIVLLRTPLATGGAGDEAGPLLPDLEDLEVSRVEIRSAEVDWLRLERGAEGWSVASAGGYPVEAGKVDDLLANLRGLERSRPVVTSSRYHASLKVTEDEPEARIRVYGDDSGDAAADLILGSSPNYRTTHARLAGDEIVYEVRGMASYDVRPDASAWVERRFLDVETDRVAGVGLANGAGSFELERVGEAWEAIVSPASGKAIDPGKVESLIASVSSLHIADPVGAPDRAALGLDPAAATLTLRLSPDEDENAGEEIVLLVGDVLEDNESQRYVMKEGFPFAATVWKSSVDDLVEKTLDDLLESDEGE